MKDITTTLKLKPYLVQWLTHHFGEPVRFPPRSYENMLLVRLIEKQPNGWCSRSMGEPGYVQIIIPDNIRKRPEYFNYLGRNAQKVMASAIEDLFILQLWRACCPLLLTRGTLNSGLNTWCASNGISLDYREGIRQRFYRMRAEYRRYGINIGDKYRKTLSLPPQKMNNQENEET